jgi:orotate phosphoribosyltransferase
LLVPGRKVALLDDVITQGGSVLKAIDAVQERGCEIVAVLAIVDRNAGGGDKLRARGLSYRYAFQADANGDLHPWQGR